MEQLLEFATNHRFLVAALGAVIVFIIVTEIRLRGAAKSINTQQAVRLINDDDALILDVRDSNEYKAAHILNALHIPMAKLATEASNVIKDKSRPIIVCCKSGNRSSEASKILSAAGYTNVSQLKNGFFAWQDANLPIEK
jgi:rhodanese-related sulfurtransferase